MLYFLISGVPIFGLLIFGLQIFGLLIFGLLASSSIRDLGLGYRKLR